MNISYISTGYHCDISAHTHVFTMRQNMWYLSESDFLCLTRRYPVPSTFLQTHDSIFLYGRRIPHCVRMCVYHVSLPKDGHLGWFYDLAIENNAPQSWTGGCTSVIPTLRDSHISEADLSYTAKLSQSKQNPDGAVLLWTSECRHLCCMLMKMTVSYMLRSGLSGSHGPFLGFLCECLPQHACGVRGNCRSWFSSLLTWLPGRNSGDQAPLLTEPSHWSFCLLVVVVNIYISNPPCCDNISNTSDLGEVHLGLVSQRMVHHDREGEVAATAGSTVEQPVVQIVHVLSDYSAGLEL